MPRRKENVKRLDYDSLRTMHFEFLPLLFDNDVMFVFLSISSIAAQSKAKSIDGTDEHYDGHVWTKTMTTNINNNLSLTFRSLACISHLECQISLYEYLQQAHQTSSVNDTKFKGFTKEPFPNGGPSSMGFTLVCKICKTYQCVMTIACCNLYFEDKDAQVLFIKNLNHIIARKRLLSP